MLKTTILTLAAAAALVAQPIPASYKDLKYPPLNPIKIPPVARHVLPNGMTLFLVEDNELPMVEARAVVRTGDRWDPPAQAGLADLTLRVMRTGGSANRPGDALDKELDRLAATVETASGEGSASGFVSVLKEDAEKGLTILADILRNPAFPQDKLELAKIDVRDSIGRRNDNAGAIHSREFNRLLYGKSSPYALRPEYATLDAISRDDLVAFHRQYFQPENVILAVWGDFQAPAMKALVERVFGSWPRGGKPKPAVPAVDVTAQAKGLHLITKGDVNQSTIGVGFLLGRRDDPDYFALVVMTEILGGSFGSRLTDAVRTREGLAYSAGAGYSAEYDHPGIWAARAGTKSGSTLQALASMRREIASMKQGEVTDAEMQRAKDSILKGEAFDYDSVGKIVGRLVTYEYYGYPSDYLQKFRAGIQKVSKADVLRVARQNLVEDRFLTLVLGNPKEFDKPLSSLGPVADVDITIPPPKAAAVAGATAETEAQCRRLLERARQAHGGAALARVSDYTAKLDMTMATPQGDFAMKGEATVSLAGKALMKMTTPMGEIVQGFDGATVWVKTPQGVRDMPASAAEQARANSLRETISLLASWDKPGFSVQALGPSQLEGRPVEGVLVKNESARFEVRVFLDPATGLIAGKSYIGQAPMGSTGEITELISDIRDVEGIKFPFRAVVMSGGKKAAEQQFSELKLNSGAAANVFQKPQ